MGRDRIYWIGDRVKNELEIERRRIGISYEILSNICEKFVRSIESRSI